MKAKKAILGFFALVGIVSLCGALFVGNNMREYKAAALRAEGTVIDLKRHESHGTHGGTSSTYHPVVRFLAGKEEITFEGNRGSSTPEYSINDNVTVLYEGSDPQEAKIDEFFSLWGPTLFLVILGTVLAAAGLGGLVIMKATNYAS